MTAGHTHGKDEDADTPVFPLLRKVGSMTLDEEQAYIRDKNKLECIILKQRNGPVGPHLLFLDAASNFVDDLAAKIEEQQNG